MRGKKMNEQNKNSAKLTDDIFYKYNYLRADKKSFDEKEKIFWEGYEEGFGSGKEAMRKAQFENRKSNFFQRILNLIKNE